MKTRWVGIVVFVGCVGLAGCSHLAGGERWRRAQSHLAPSAAPKGVRGLWHVDLSLRTGFPKLDSTDRALERRLDVPLRSDFLRNFRRPRTPLDRRSDLGLTTAQVGFGKTVSDRWLWTFSAGALAGSDASHQRILTSSLSVHFRYAYYFMRLGTEFYPWGLPPLERVRTWSERFRASRVFVAAGLEVGFLRASGWGDFTIPPSRLYKASQHVRDWLASVSLGAGLAIPLGLRWSVILESEYGFHLYRPEEFNGWTVSTGLRVRF